MLPLIDVILVDFMFRHRAAGHQPSLFRGGMMPETRSFTAAAAG